MRVRRSRAQHDRRRRPVHHDGDGGLVLAARARLLDDPLRGRARALGWVHWGATSQDVIDTALVVIAGAAHLSNVERPDQFTTHVMHFLAAHDRITKNRHIIFCIFPLQQALMHTTNQANPVW